MNRVYRISRIGLYQVYRFYRVYRIRLQKSILFVPISGLLFFESILTILHVPSADFSFKKFSVMARCRSPLVMCDTSDESTHALLSSSIIVGDRKSVV